MSHGIWVNILKHWYVMSSDIKTVGDFITVSKKNGMTEELLIESIVGTFEDKIIYAVSKD